MAIALLRKIFSSRQSSKPQLGSKNKLFSNASCFVEPLELRRMLTASSTYFSNNWHLATDTAPTSTLNVGDLVDGAASSSKVYGTTAFGTISSGTPSGSLVGSSTMSDAIGATSSGGIARVQSGTYSGSINVNNDITLLGDFTLSSGNLTVSDADAALAVGYYGGDDVNYGWGTITLSNGNLSLVSGSTLVMQAVSSSVHSLINVAGTVALNGATLDLSLAYGDNTSAQTFTIIANDNTDAVSGTFAGLAEGAEFQVGHRRAKISYVGGSNSNDVTLTVLPTGIVPYTTYVNDNWYISTDVAPTSTLSTGDTVNGSNDSLASISAKYGVVGLDATPGNNAIYKQAFTSIASAVTATANEGSIVVLPGTYTENVAINRSLGLRGTFTLNGDLSLTAAGAGLNTDDNGGTITVDDLTLASGTTVTLLAGQDLIVTNGAVNLGSATLSLVGAGLETANVTLIDNNGGSAITGTFANLPEGAPVLLGGQLFYITYLGGVSGRDVVLTLPTAEVLGRQLFYNQSSFDGNSTAVNSSDDSAIATDKSALLPGEASAFANVSSFTRGINGIMIDIAGSHPNISASDFLVRAGNNNAPSTWSNAATPTVTVRAGAGVSGSDRVELTWASGSVKNTWLQVNVLPNGNTGLTSADVFYFGSRVGETSHTGTNAFLTSAADEIAIRNYILDSSKPHSGLPLTNQYDLNKDGLTSASDEISARNNVGATVYFTPPGGVRIDSVQLPKNVSANGTVTVTAINVVDPSSTMTGLKFYLDVNNNGIWDSGDTFLANATQLLDFWSDPTPNWSAQFSASVLASGSNGILAVPVNANGNMDVDVERPADFIGGTPNPLNNLGRFFVSGRNFVTQLPTQVQYGLVQNEYFKSVAASGGQDFEIELYGGDTEGEIVWSGAGDPDNTAIVHGVGGLWVNEASEEASLNAFALGYAESKLGGTIAEVSATATVEASGITSTDSGTIDGSIWADASAWGQYTITGVDARGLPLLNGTPVTVMYTLIYSQYAHAEGGDSSAHTNFTMDYPNYLTDYFDDSNPGSQTLGSIQTFFVQTTIGASITLSIGVTAVATLDTIDELEFNNGSSSIVAMASGAVIR